MNREPTLVSVRRAFLEIGRTPTAVYLCNGMSQRLRIRVCPSDSERASDLAETPHHILVGIYRSPCDFSTFAADVLATVTEIYQREFY